MVFLSLGLPRMCFDHYKKKSGYVRSTASCPAAYVYKGDSPLKRTPTIALVGHCPKNTPCEQNASLDNGWIQIKNPDSDILRRFNYKSLDYDMVQVVKLNNQSQNNFCTGGEKAILKPEYFIPLYNLYVGVKDAIENQKKCRKTGKVCLFYKNNTIEKITNCEIEDHQPNIGPKYKRLLADVGEPNKYEMNHFATDKTNTGDFKVLEVYKNLETCKNWKIDAEHKNNYIDISCHTTNSNSNYCIDPEECIGQQVRKDTSTKKCLDWSTGKQTSNGVCRFGPAYSQECRQKFDQLWSLDEYPYITCNSKDTLTCGTKYCTKCPSCSE